MSVETAIVALATSAVKSALKLWMANAAIAADTSGEALDLLSGKLRGLLEKRRLSVLIDQMINVVAERLEPLLVTEFGRLPGNERQAAILAVRDTLAASPLSNADLFAFDLDARHLARQIQQSHPNASVDLSDAAQSLYSLLLRETCGYMIEVSRALPGFSSNALTELLRRDTEVLTLVRDVLARMPQRRDVNDFAYDYRQLVARTLDRVEIFGASLSSVSRTYPLTVAYLSLTVSPTSISSDDQPPSAGLRVESILTQSKRLFLRGEAGLGKTTLLQWIAVRCARRDFPQELAMLNGTIAFFLPLRRYTDGRYPDPANFLDEVGRHIADEMPDGWVQQQLRSGRAIVLVDGLDEVPADLRNDVRVWLRQLIASFPRARYIITSRPGAAPPNWLNNDDFDVADLLPMSPSDVGVFVRRWHSAVSDQHADLDAREMVQSYESQILEKIAQHNHLRKLAGYPLLCALLCALHHDRHGDLPGSRMELYEVALHMLLERRDSERKISAVQGLNRTEKLLLLSNIAYWLMRNGLSYAPVSRVVNQIESRLGGMPAVRADAMQVYRHLLERTGLLREPLEGHVAG